jgi:hypothetical protein
MKLEELISKMQQIEEQVALTLDEYPHGHTLERQRLVLSIAKQVRAHLADQLTGGERKPVEGLAVALDRVGDARVRVAVFPSRPLTSADKPPGSGAN